MINKHFQTFLAISVFSFCGLFAQTSTTLMSSSSSIDWTTQIFSSQVLFDVEKSGINLPSGKNSALDTIKLRMPKLIKDQILSLSVNSSQKLGDLVLNEDITLEQITQIVENGKRTPGFFTGGSLVMKTNHSLDLHEISSLMVKHHTPYTTKEPIEQIPSRAFTGIIIDARGQRSVHGEFIQDSIYPCFFPRIWDEKMNLIYERNMTESEMAKQSGIVLYDYSEDETRYKDRIGTDPLRILAKEVFGQNRTDPIISRNDALKILTVPENLELLRQGKVVILLDKENLIYDVSAPLKDERYYTALKTVRQLLYTDMVPDLTISDSYKGILFQVDLKFYPDSSVLLPEENSRLSQIAKVLAEITQTNEFTILVEGHTAEVGKPEGELNLSIDRAQSVIHALEGFGVNKDLFSFQGYGGTQPVADNDTAEGRAQNRRVDITARPKATYIQRSN